MRPGQKNRMRGGRGNNNNRRGPNPLTRSYESNGPDMKVRGTPQHIAEKYVQLARDAHSSGDTVMAESYLQHAEHYYRIIAAAQNAQQQAWNQANGIPNTEAEQLEDEDEFEVAGADRFTFRAPQNFQQPQGGGFNGQNGGYAQQPYQQGQPYNADPGAGDQPPMPEGQPMQGQPAPGEGGQQNYQQQPRGDRPFGNRRFDERNNRRFGRDRGDRNFGGDRQGGDNRPQGDRPFNDRPQGERPQFQPRNEGPREASDGDAPLPSFITGSRGQVQDSAPQDDAGEAGGGEAGFRPRRRRRGRGSAEGAPEAGGEE
jgi:hypothetical protein